MGNYDTPAELRGLENKLRNLCSTGLDMSRVFEDWLRFIIGNFTLEPKPIENWPYTKDQNLAFHDMMFEWFDIMRANVQEDETWYDVFGELYMSLIVSSSQAQMTGQFFTPPHICDLMQAISVSNETTLVGRGCVCDPTCGSGRLLLAFHVKHLGHYLVAEDLSYVCCLMTVCNFLIHGCVGEVVWHNSLEPQSWYGGWSVNYDFKSTFGLPHAKEIEKEHSIIWQHWERKKNESTVIEMTPRGHNYLEPIQMQLF